jgi:hypothetical protein
MWWVGFPTGAMYLLCLLLKPMTGEVNARFLSAGVIVAVNFIGIESLRSQAGFGVDRLLTPARLIYFAASIWVLPAITDLLLQIEPGAPDWLPAIAPHVVSIAVSFPVVLLAHCSAVSPSRPTRYAPPIVASSAPLWSCGDGTAQPRLRAPAVTAAG